MFFHHTLSTFYIIKAVLFLLNLINKRSIRLMMILLAKYNQALPFHHDFVE